MSTESESEVFCFSYWTDPLCIWAYVAQAKLDDLLATSTANLEIKHRIVPVFGSVVQRFRDGSWAKAGPEGRAATTRKVAERFGHSNVTGQVWVDDPPASSWSPSLAIKSVFGAEAAEEVAVGSGREYQWCLREWLFGRNLNIARRSVQLQAAEECGLAAEFVQTRIDDGRAMAALWEDFQQKEALGVQGSPTYVFDGAREMLYGNVPLELIKATVDVLARDGAPGRSPC